MKKMFTIVKLNSTALKPTIESQAEALRFVVLVDRLYDRDVPVLLGSSGETALFPPAMLAGGYRKKYLRALSRLGALAELDLEGAPRQEASGIFLVRASPRASAKVRAFTEHLLESIGGSASWVSDAAMAGV